MRFQGYQGGRRESGRIEIRQAITGVAVQVERRACVLANIEAIVIYAVRDAALQRIVVVAFERHGKTCAGACDAAQLPALRHTRPFFGQSVKRKSIVVADDEIVRQIPSGKGTRLPEIERIRRIAQCRALIDGLTVRVPELKSKVSTGVAH